MGELINTGAVGGQYAAVGAMSAGVGFIADRKITLPIPSTGNTLYNGLIDAGFGVAVAAVGSRLDHGVVGPGVFGFGVGWAVSALASAAGIF
jgi:hypothetical protein